MTKCIFVASWSQVLIETFRELLSDLIITQKTSTSGKTSLGVSCNIIFLLSVVEEPGREAGPSGQKACL